MEIWIKERGDDAPIEAALVPLSTWQELWAVADAARELARQWEEEEAGGQPLGWLLSALADALDALDKEE